jgi:hypothetical protein
MAVSRAFKVGVTPVSFALSAARRAAAQVSPPEVANATSSWTRIAALGTRKRLRALRRLRQDRYAYIGSVAGWAHAVALLSAAIDDVISVASVERHCRYVGIEVDDEILTPIVQGVAAAHAARNLKTNPRILGELLQLTIVERDELKIRNIDSCEETADQRKARLARERAAEHRVARGAKPRATSITQSKEWERHGYRSRRTWERHGKVPRTSPDAANSSPSQMIHIEEKGA